MMLFEQKYGSLEYDPSVPCITATFNGFMSSGQFRDFLSRGLDHLIEKKKDHQRILWLADTRKHVVQPDKDTKWVADEWNPRAIEGGINHVAFVLPENAFGNLSVRKYADNSERKGDNMMVQMFDNLESAKAWFRDLN